LGKITAEFQWFEIQPYYVLEYAKRVWITFGMLLLRYIQSA